MSIAVDKGAREEEAGPITSARMATSVASSSKPIPPGQQAAVWLQGLFGQKGATRPLKFMVRSRARQKRRRRVPVCPQLTRLVVWWCG